MPDSNTYTKQNLSGSDEKCAATLPPARTLTHTHTHTMHMRSPRPRPRQWTSAATCTRESAKILFCFLTIPSSSILLCFRYGNIQKEFGRNFCTLVMFHSIAATSKLPFMHVIALRIVVECHFESVAIAQAPEYRKVDPWNSRLRCFTHIHPHNIDLLTNSTLTNTIYCNHIYRSIRNAVSIHKTTECNISISELPSNYFRLFPPLHMPCQLSLFRQQNTAINRRMQCMRPCKTRHKTKSKKWNGKHSNVSEKIRTFCLIFVLHSFCKSIISFAMKNVNNVQLLQSVCYILCS